MIELDKLDPAIWKNQAGDVMNLVSIFINTYYGAYRLSWDREADRRFLVNTAFNGYLKNKGYQMRL